jgi:PA domain
LTGADQSVTLTAEKSGEIMSIIPRAFLLAAVPMIIGATDAPADIITPEAMRAHIEFLASDSLEGRETGTRGYDISAEYVATRFRAMGLQPVSNKGWFQQVPFVANLVDEKSAKFSINEKEFALRQDVRFGPSRKGGTEAVEGDIVFAGFGIDDPKNGQNDYKGIDVKGKIVAVLSGFPKGMASDVGAHYGRSKAKMAEARGAIGIVTVRTLETETTRPWARNERPTAPLNGMGAGRWQQIRRSTCNPLFRATGRQSGKGAFCHCPQKT